MLVAQADASSSAARLSLPLHLTLVEDETSLPLGQPRLGIPEIRTMRRSHTAKIVGDIRKGPSMAEGIDGKAA